MSDKLRRKVLWAVCLTALCRLAFGQGAVTPPSGPSLHLAAVVTRFNSADSYEPQIYCFDQGSGGLKLAYTVPLGEGGLDFMRADYKSRRLIFGWPADIPTKLGIVNMDAVESPTILHLDFSDVPASAWSPLPADWYVGEMAKPSNKVFVDDHPMLLERPGIGEHWLALKLFSFRGELTVGYRLDSKPQREIVDAGALSGLRIQGDFGLAVQLGDSDAPFTFGHVRDGKVFAGVIDIGVPAPEGTSDPKVQWRLVAHDGNTTVMYRHTMEHAPQGPRREHLPTEQDTSGIANCTSSLYIRGGRSGEWKTFQVPGLEPRVKMIDSWVMGAAVCDGLGRESPGAAERRRYQERYREEAEENDRREGRVPTDRVFQSNKIYLPGILFLIDATTGRYFEIRTGQGDSEILLVHDNTVYYRVNDSVFAAPLQGNTVGKGRPLVRHDAIPDVHWAFWGS